MTSKRSIYWVLSLLLAIPFLAASAPPRNTKADKEADKEVRWGEAAHEGRCLPMTD